MERTNTYRIHSNLLLQINYSKRTVGNIMKYTDTDSNSNTNIQYFDKDLLSNNIWYHNKTLNKLWYSDNEIKIDNQNITEVSNEKLVDISVFVQQGFNFSEYYGFALVLKDIKTNMVYCSYLLNIDNFKFTDGEMSREIINGTYWNYRFDTKIPDTLLNETTLGFAVELVKVSDIDADTKTISNYPTQFEPLIDDLPFVDNLIISCEWDDNLNLRIEPKSLIENLTTLQVLQYQFSETEIDNIGIQHLVRFPADEFGNYAEYTIQNNVNPLGPVVIGLPLVDSTTRQKIDITTYIRVNGKLGVRSNSILWDFVNPINSALAKVIATPDEQTNLHQVFVEEKFVIQNDTIDVINNYKTIQVSVPKYIELITNKTIQIDNKNISLQEITDVNSYMKVYFKPEESSSENVILLAQKTGENLIYFDMNEVNTKMKVSATNTIPFKVYSFEDNHLLLSGTITKPTT